MAVKLITFLALSTLFLTAQCHNPAGRDGHGLIGYGIDMYFPTCCTACRDVLSSSQLNCSEAMSADEMADMDMDDGDFETSVDCYTTDDAFLQSLALCISQRCPKDPSLGADFKNWQIEQWWQRNVAGRQKVQPDPKETYGEALAKVKTIPTETLTPGDPLNRTMLVSEDDYQISWNADMSFETAEDTHSLYSLIVFLSGVVIPIGFSLLRFLPFPSRWATLFNAWIIDPPAVGKNHKVPILWGLTKMPTRGQAFFIAYLTTINVVLSAVGYKSVQPNAWFETPSEILTYVTNRLGVLSFANVPLLILYAGRNNVLLWLTNWRHETFLILHRYIAALATLQAILHSCIYLQIDIANGSYSENLKLPYWIWGAVGTVAMSVLLPSSILPIRKMFYEAFLLWHIAISVLVLVGCYLHIYHRFNHQWGYELWIYVAVAIWGFDRIVRILRVARNGFRWAKIRVVDEDYVRVDIEGIGGNGHAYLYFPTLTWRVWENHPFSVASTVQYSARLSNQSKSTSDLEKNVSHSVTEVGSSDDESLNDGRSARLVMTFLLRTRGGLTSLLRSCSRVPVFVESSYGQHPDTSKNATLICIAGGVGITTVLPLLHAHAGRSKLLWGVRSSGIVEAMANELAGIDKDVFIGQRMIVREELEKEVNAGEIGQNAMVVVSGPESMADDVRNAVCEIAKQSEKITIRLVEESFSW